MRNLFFKGFAAITMGLTMTACMQEFDYEEQEQKTSLPMRKHMRLPLNRLMYMPFAMLLKLQTATT